MGSLLFFGAIFLISQFISNSSVDDVYGWVRYYRFISVLMFHGQSALLIVILEWKWLTLIFDEYIPNSTPIMQEASDNHGRFWLRALKIAKLSKMTSEERTKFLLTHSLITVLFGIALIIGESAEWYQYPFLFGDLIIIAQSIAIMAAVQLQGLLQSLHDAVVRLKRLNEMPLTEIVASNTKMLSSFTPSEFMQMDGSSSLKSK
jgi:hypothetical protein